MNCKSSQLGRDNTESVWDSRDAAPCQAWLFLYFFSSPLPRCSIRRDNLILSRSSISFAGGKWLYGQFWNIVPSRPATTTRRSYFGVACIESMPAGNTTIGREVRGCFRDCDLSLRLEARGLSLMPVISWPLIRRYTSYRPRGLCPLLSDGTYLVVIRTEFLFNYPKYRRPYPCFISFFFHVVD